MLRSSYCTHWRGIDSRTWWTAFYSISHLAAKFKIVLLMAFCTYSNSATPTLLYDTLELDEAIGLLAQKLDLIIYSLYAHEITTILNHKKPTVIQISYNTRINTNLTSNM